MPSKVSGPVSLLISVIIPVLIGCSSTSSGTHFPAEDEPSTIEVIGVQNELSLNSWKDDRVGLGIQAILAEALFESGKFRLMEVKPEMQQKRREIAAGMWAGIYKDSHIKEFIAQSTARYQVMAKVIYFGRPSTSASFGVIHHESHSSVIRTEVTIIHSSSGKKWRATGDGKSSTSASSVVFTFQNDRVDFDQANIGNALRESIKDAVGKILN
ncbi:MAG: hypothetical protein GX089_16110 [Fibrobacter sp.]|nr:hypothetical protein [Fibrobacter sp.]